MSDVGGVQGGGGQQYSPEELQKYHEDYQKGYDLFQKSFQEYTQPNVEFHKKQQLQKVIEEALQVMNETACVALKKEKMGAEEQLNTDYQQFVKDPTQENQQKVSEDLKSLGD